MNGALCEKDAAEYCGVKIAHFRRKFQVLARSAHGKKVYLVRDLDQYLTRLPPWTTRKYQKAA